MSNRLGTNDPIYDASRLQSFPQSTNSSDLSSADGIYLRLDTTNDPLVGPLDIQIDDANALRVLTEGTSGVYAFPITSVLDNFNRADGGPPPGASWTTPAAAEDGLLTHNNGCISASENSDAQAVWSPLSAVVNTEVYCDTTANAGCPYFAVSLFARIQDADDLTAGSYFVTFIYNPPNPATVSLSIYHSGSISTVTSNYAWLPGQSLGFMCEDVGGNVRLHAYHKIGLGAWIEIASAGDAVYKYANGKIGLQISEAGNTLNDFALVDNFGGGSIPAGTYSRQVFNVNSLTDLTTVYQLEATAHNYL